MSGNTWNWPAAFVKPLAAQLQATVEGWKPVLEAGDCPLCDCCGEYFCPRCETHYYECSCPGPHQDDLYEYREIDGVLYARELPNG